MIKVLIAEDEVLVRVGIKSAVQWEQYGFEFLEDAKNGQEAMAVIRRDKPDILLTDIRMPGMDGIELIRKIREEHINMDIIVLSAYDDFELVKDAMKLGASDYIRKLSMKPEDILNVLLQQKEKIVRKADEDALTAKENINDAVLANEYFVSLVNGDVSVDESTFDIKRKISWECGFAICFTIDHYESVLKRYNVVVLNSYVKSLCEQILKRAFIPGEVFQVEKDEFGMAVDTGRKNINDLMGRLQSDILNNMNIGISIASGPEFTSRQGFVDSYSIARNIRLIKFYNHQGFRCEIKQRPEMKKKVTFEEIYPEEILKKALESGNKESAASIIENAFKGIRASGYIHPETVKKIAIGLLNVFSDVSHKYGFDVDDFVDEESRLPHRIILSAEFLQDMADWFKSYVPEYIDRFENRLNHRYSKLVKEAIHYIESHKNKNLTLSAISGAVNANESYLSHLFRKETGKTLTVYIGKLKIEMAKALLSKGFLVYEVSDRLGFENSNYFSKVFKKFTGITPEQYRLPFKTKTE